MKPTSLEQALNLQACLRAAKMAFERTGLGLVHGERLAPKEYTESEVVGRYEGVWWMLSIAINDATELVRQWKEEA